MENNQNTAERNVQLFRVEIDAPNKELIGLRQEALALAYDGIQGSSFPGFEVIPGDGSGMFATAVEFRRGGSSLSINHCHDGAVLLTAKRRIEAEFKSQSIEAKTVCELRCDGASVWNVGNYISPLSDHTPGQTIWDLDYWRDVISSVRDVAAAEQESLGQKRSRSWISRFAGKLATTKT